MTSPIRQDYASEFFLGDLREVENPDTEIQAQASRRPRRSRKQRLGSASDDAGHAKEKYYKRNHEEPGLCTKTVKTIKKAKKSYDYRQQQAKKKAALEAQVMALQKKNDLLQGQVDTAQKTIEDLQQQNIEVSNKLYWAQHEMEFYRDSCRTPFNFQGLVRQDLVLASASSASIIPLPSAYDETQQNSLECELFSAELEHSYNIN